MTVEVAPVRREEVLGPTSAASPSPRAMEARASVARLLRIIESAEAIHSEATIGAKMPPLPSALLCLVLSLSLFAAEVVVVVMVFGRRPTARPGALGTARNRSTEAAHAATISEKMRDGREAPSLSSHDASSTSVLW